MKEERIYCCEICGYKNEDSGTVYRHEAAHFNMTPELIKTYKRLQAKVRQASHSVSVSKNSVNEEEYDRAIQAVMDFEKANKMSKEAIEWYTLGQGR